MADKTVELADWVKEYFRFSNFTKHEFKIKVGNRTTVMAFDSNEDPRSKFNGVVVQPGDFALETITIYIYALCRIHLIFEFEDGFDDEFVLKFHGTKRKFTSPNITLLDEFEWIKRNHDIKLTQQDKGDNVAGVFDIGQTVNVVVNVLHEKLFERKAIQLKKNSEKMLRRKQFSEALYLINNAIYIHMAIAAENQNVHDELMNLKHDIVLKLCDELQKEKKYAQASSTLDDALRNSEMKSEMFVIMKNKISDIHALRKQEKAKIATKCCHFDEAINLINNAIAETVDLETGKQLLITKSEILNRWGEDLLKKCFSIEMGDLDAFEKVPKMLHQAREKLEMANAINPLSASVATNLNLVEKKKRGNEIYNHLIEELNLIITQDGIPVLMTNDDTYDYDNIIILLQRIQDIRKRFVELMEDFVDASQINICFKSSIAQVSTAIDMTTHMETLLNRMEKATKNNIKKKVNLRTLKLYQTLCE